MKLKFRKNTLEHAIVELLARYPENQEFTVIYHELTNDGGSWSTNTSWRAKNYATKQEVAECARGRWEIFKLNYYPKARVKDITDIGYDDRRLMLEVNYLPFMDIEVRE